MARILEKIEQLSEQEVRAMLQEQGLLESDGSAELP